MTTTDIFQINKNYYSSKEEYDKEYKHVHTNKRYKNFKQLHFHAGDIEQFEEYRDMSNGSTPFIYLNENIYLKELKFNFWEGNKDLESICVKNTFNYIFNKLKKGIFVKIKDNKLSVFLPFSKHKYTNEWSDLVKFDPKYSKYIGNDFKEKNKHMIGFFKYIHLMNQKFSNRKYEFNSNKINKFVNTYYANNGLFKPEFPVKEGDTNNNMMKDMLENLCNKRKIPDIEFFINRRDFPIIKKNYTEPYDDIFGSNQPLISYKYDKYSPILSMSSTSEFADILIPTGDDWTRVNPDKKFQPDFPDYNFIFDIDWKNKINKAIFRGSSTGRHICVNKNMRLKASYLSLSNKQYLDAGITNWNLRPRKLKK